MGTLSEKMLRQRIKILLLIFIAALVLSGLTAFPLEWELSVLVKLTTHKAVFFNEWLNIVYTAIKDNNSKYPFMAYGTDWLAFAHLVIAIAFVGPLKDPVKNIWVIQFGMISCLMVFPLAFICGPIRSIPLYWQLIDCCFGLVAIIPLYYCYKYILKLEQVIKTIKN